jgi:hypothetical protein
MRKRVKLGLADPVVADRMRLWGFGIGTGASIQVVFSTLESMGVEMTGATSVVFVGPMGVIASAFIYLAFLPPKAYLQRVQARAAAG